MNKTLIGFMSGVAGAGIAYAVKSRDTIYSVDLIEYSEANSKTLNPSKRTASNIDTKIKMAILKSQEYAKKFKDEVGAPGLVIGASVDGKIIWEEGFGYANLETRTPCHVNSAMRIASISKPMTTALLGKLNETGKIQLDESVYKYVPFFPKKEIDGEEIDITLRQLASHTAGVRSYKKKGENTSTLDKEFYFKEKIDSIEQSIDMFKNDELLFKPGTSFEYTTHGYTLLSAAIEAAGQKPFTEQIQNLFNLLGLENTHLDYVQTIINNRTNYYNKNKNGQTINAELADLSYKWAGGGIISTVGDLLKFANAMLYSYQQDVSYKPGFLRKETVAEMWTVVDHTVMKWGEGAGYGLGWTIVPKVHDIGGVTKIHQGYIGHSGGAVGASSVLIIIPREKKFLENQGNRFTAKLPQGVAVAILINLENISCKSLAKKIGDEFYTASM